MTPPRSSRTQLLAHCRSLRNDVLPHGRAVWEIARNHAMRCAFRTELIFSKHRTAVIARARRHAMLEVRETLNLSYPVIAKLFFRLSHQTVLSAIRQAKRDLKAASQEKQAQGRDDKEAVSDSLQGGGTQCARN